MINEADKEIKNINKYKLILIGNIGTGKTSIINRIVNNTYNDQYESTLSFK